MTKINFLRQFTHNLSHKEKILAVLRMMILDIDTIDSNLPAKGKIYDIGCSSGLVSYYLGRIPGRKLVGIDINPARVEKARLSGSTKYNNVSFFCQDVLKTKFFQIKGVVLSDFLHHIDFKKQEKLLLTLYRELPAGSKIIIKEIDDDEMIRKHLSRLWDFTLYPEDQIFYRSRKDWSSFLNKLGFHVVSKSAVRWFPASTTLFICTKVK